MNNQRVKILVVETQHDTFTIINLKKVWISRTLFIYRLMYEDEENSQCVFWSFSRSELEKAKQCIKKAYNQGEFIIEL